MWTPETDHIRKLHAENRELRQEIERLRAELRFISGHAHAVSDRLDAQPPESEERNG